MGFIPQINTKTLYAYLTQKGREYILNGNKEDFQIAYFTLHDEDVNYYISSNISAGTTYYTLQSGFVPDITGDADTCIKSIAAGTGVNTMSTLSGSTVIDPVTGKPTVGPLGSDGTVGARVTTINGPTPTTINGGNLIAGRPIYSTSLIVTITPPLGDTNPVTTTEIANSKFYIEILNPISIIGNLTIGGISTNKLLYTPSSTSTRVDIGYALTVSPSTNTNITFGIKITPFNTSSPVNNSSINYTAIYPVTTTGNDRTTTTTPTTTPPGSSFGGTGGAGGA
jgi:hypothetical protein